MKHLSIALTAGLLIPSLFTTARSTAPTCSQDGVTQDGAEQEATALQAAMGTLQKGQRGLRNLIGEPVENKAKLMETLIAMEGAVLTALKESPPEPNDMPEAELALWRVGYKRTMAGLFGNILAMEEATLKADGEALTAAYKQLGKTKKGGHEEYQVD